jgi:hypothetical protein
MPAKSKSQQRLMGMVYAYKKGYLRNTKSLNKNFLKGIKKLAKNMNEEDLEDFAKTKHKNIPEKIEKKESLKYLISFSNFV